MALSITELKKGTLIQLGSEPYKVIEYAQKVMGRGGSIVNVRIKSLIDGRVLDKTFKGNEQVESADVTNQFAQYLYADENDFFFMDTDSYDQFNISAKLVSEQSAYLKEGDRVQLQFFKGQPISVELPNSVILKVTYTESVTKGNTANSITKDAQLETGITVKVPAFIRQGDTIKVDTRTGDYLERVKS